MALPLLTPSRERHGEERAERRHEHRRVKEMDRRVQLGEPGHDEAWRLHGGPQDAGLQRPESRRVVHDEPQRAGRDRKNTRLNSSHSSSSYAVFCLKKKKNTNILLYLNKKNKQKNQENCK